MALSSALTNDYPGISIDPVEGAVGLKPGDPMTVRYEGPIRNTAFGQTLFMADWDMKLLGLGDFRGDLAGLPPGFPIRYSDKRGSQPARHHTLFDVYRGLNLPPINGAMDRFWFKQGQNDVLVFQGDSLVVLDTQLLVDTERERGLGVDGLAVATAIGPWRTRPLARSGEAAWVCGIAPGKPSTTDFQQLVPGRRSAGAPILLRP